MKQIKLFFRYLYWLFIAEKPKKITANQERSYKIGFRFFFEGIKDEQGIYVEPSIDIPVRNFGITNFKFERFKEYLLITITLERPGILIGKRGHVIDELKKYLSTRELKMPVKFNLIESKIWY